MFSTVVARFGFQPRRVGYYCNDMDMIFNQYSGICDTNDSGNLIIEERVYNKV